MKAIGYQKSLPIEDENVLQNFEMEVPKAKGHDQRRKPHQSLRNARITTGPRENSTGRVLKTISGKSAADWAQHYLRYQVLNALLRTWRSH